MDKKLARLSFFNRQPTLWRHGIGAVEIIPSLEDEDFSIGLSPLTIEPFNADFDGDACPIYIIHDKKALQEMTEKAFIMNTIRYDSNDEMLATIRHESLYAAYILTEKITPNDNIIQCISNLNELYEDIELFNNNLSDTVVFNNNLYYTYGMCLLNKWCGFNEIIINETITKKNSELVSEKIYEYFKDNKTYYNRLSELNKRLLIFISSSNNCPSLVVDEMLCLVDEQTKKLFDKLPSENPELGYAINEALVDRCIQYWDSNSSLYKQYRSGSRFSKQQLSRICINIGYTADDNNIIDPNPVKTNLITGLESETFFRGSIGTRKGVADKAQFTPDSGFMERALTMSLSPLVLLEDDCKCDDYLTIKVLNKKHAKTLVGKYYKDGNSEKLIDISFANSVIGSQLQIRSPITCITPNYGMCRRCYGDRYHPTKYLGITAAQCLSERLTQLIMRSFHLSGNANLDINPEVFTFIKDHLQDIEYINDDIILKFNNINIPESIKTIRGFNHIHNNIVTFNKYKKRLQNKDAIFVMLKVKDLLKTQRTNILTPSQYYENMMEVLLKVGTPYSSFVEMLFANMFVCDDNSTVFWRYNKDKKIITKLGEKILAFKISKLLGILFQPNRRTLAKLNNIEDMCDVLTDETKLNIYEKICLGLYN